MRVSLVIPVKNAAPLLRRTLRSIAAAGGSDVGVFVRDGDSGDGVAAVVAEFGGLVSSFVSQADKGQYDAIRAGMKEADGEVTGWINAGDVLMPGALDTVERIFSEHPEVSWLTGRACLADEGAVAIIPTHRVLVSNAEIRLGLCRPGAAGFLQQEGMFWRRDLWERCGGLNAERSLAADFELWTRFAAQAPLHRIDVPLAAFSHHHDNRSIVQRERYLAEVAEVIAAFPAKTRGRSRMTRPFTLVMKALGRMPGLRVLLSMMLRPFPGLRVEEFGWGRDGSGGLILRKCVRTAWFG